ncbi:erythromycin esterase family protein [Winogradskya consettensis]|uniref:Erythromycin esterase n=1 Tax=Winogradskya consettensis TaxID=113560 RepID=A0A919SN94_9ACTN|nr:erythromycin esterase family protein [Actinoplanes consettensis]GIM75286.1 erythromycin esterase [Actinoplanes consettensis]
MLKDFRTFVAESAVPLDRVDGGLFGDARIVAVGESSHWVGEYYAVRQRLTRVLVEQCGFEVVAMESGFSEGLAVDEWVRGGAGDLDELVERGFTYRMGLLPEMRTQLEWMRAANNLRFLGLDVSGSATSNLPALEHVRARLEDAELPVMDELLGLTRRYASEHGLLAYMAYGKMEQGERDRATALLIDLLTRLEIRRADATTRHELRLAVLLDQLLRGNHAARDLGMAETALTRTDKKTVIGAANSHLQRVPMQLPGLSVPTLGHHLRDERFLSIAVTALKGWTPTRRRDPDAPGGVAVVNAELPEPRADSVEAAFAGGDVAQLVDLRPARGKLSGPACVRVMDSFQDVDVLTAYDMIVCVPELSPSEWVDADR